MPIRMPLPTTLTALLADLLDLALPTSCPGCGTSSRDAHPDGPVRLAGLACPACPDCRRAVEAARAGPVRPVPAPVGLPPCAALGGYGGTLRELLLSYKERGGWGLTGLLGAGLAASVRVVSPGPGPLILVPVPATAAAIRARQGDHVRRLARVAATHLRHSSPAPGDSGRLGPGRAGRTVVIRSVVRATGGVPDSTELDAAGRARRAGSAFAPRAGALARIGGGPGLPGGGRGGGVVEVVVVDDIVTTGATLAAVARVLAGCGVGVAGAAVVAATPRRWAVRAKAGNPGAADLRSGEPL
jgi:predicted amidophosphoribosyltransferase